MRKRCFVLSLIVCVMAAFLVQPWVTPAQAGGSIWTAYYRSGDGNHLIYFQNGGNVITDQFLFNLQGYSFDQNIAISRTGHYGAYLIRPGNQTPNNPITLIVQDLTQPASSAASLVPVISFPLPAQARALINGTPLVYSPDDTQLAFAYAVGNASKIVIFTLNPAQSQPTTTITTQQVPLLATDPAFVPRIDNFGGQAIYYSLVSGEGDSSSVKSFLLQLPSTASADATYSGSRGTDTFAPTNETIFSAADSSFETVTFPPGYTQFNTLKGSSSTETVNPFTFYTNKNLNFLTPHFIQNGERILDVASNDQSQTRLLMLERSGKVLSNLDLNSSVTPGIFGLKDGYLLALYDANQVTVYSVSTRNTPPDPLGRNKEWTHADSPVGKVVWAKDSVPMPVGQLTPWQTLHTAVTNCPNALPSRLTVGGIAHVIPGGADNNLRTAPTNGDIIGKIPPGSTISVVEGPTCGSDSIAWWKVNFNGVVGFTAEGQSGTYYLAPGAGGGDTSGGGSASSSPTIVPPASGTFGIVGVTANVNPTSASVCPTNFIFAGQIVVNEPGTVTYRWERSDGTTGPTVSAVFGTGVTTQDVSDAWNVGSSSSGWEHLHVLTPNDVTSNNAIFTLNCNAPTATLSPIHFIPVFQATGATNSTSSITLAACPKTLYFNGTITANAAGTVTYQWDTNKSMAYGGVHSLTFSAAGTQKVQLPLVETKATSGWVTLRVVTPNLLFSNQVNFTVTCS